MSTAQKRFDLQPYLRREPVVLALLMGLTIVLFAAVAGISRLYYRQQEALAERWSVRGTDDLNAGRFSAAVVAFRTSLLYSRDNYVYQLKLSEALLGENRTDEAYGYLRNLWDRQPENGFVNLELARIDASRGQTENALRYYHNAIYAIWPADQNQERRNTSLELIHYLLRIGDTAQADSELIALAANLGNNPAERTLAGQLFLQAQDSERARAQFRLALQGNRRDVAAMTGAGNAAFQLGRYSEAARYLRQGLDAGDKSAEPQLKMAELVLDLDPFRPVLKAANRDRMVMQGFAAAGSRLKACSTPGSFSVPADELTKFDQAWTKLKPQITERELRRNPDLVNTAMALVFSIEHETSGMCGGMTDTDNALLLIANQHEGL